MEQGVKIDDGIVKVNADPHVRLSCRSAGGPPCQPPGHPAPDWSSTTDKHCLWRCRVSIDPQEKVWSSAGNERRDCCRHFCNKFALPLSKWLLFWVFLWNYFQAKLEIIELCLPMQTNPILGTSSALLLINDMNRSHFSSVALGERSGNVTNDRYWREIPSGASIFGALNEFNFMYGLPPCVRFDFAGTINGVCSENK